MSNPFVAVVLVLAGLVEFVIRVAFTMIFVMVTFCFLMLDREPTMDELLIPYCWRMLMQQDKIKALQHQVDLLKVEPARVSKFG